MHENREISSTPWSDDQGRSAKATSRTADMYVAGVGVVEPGWRCLVVAHQILGADLVEVPKRPVIRSDIHHVSNHVIGRRYAFLPGESIWSFAWEPLFEHGRDPGRAVAERFNLLILDEDGVAANPVIATDRAVKDF